MHFVQFVSIGTFPPCEISLSCLISSALFFLLKPLAFLFLIPLSIVLLSYLKNQYSVFPAVGVSVGGASVVDCIEGS